MTFFAQVADILRTRGRTTGTLIDRNGCVCPLGAIALLRGVPEEDLKENSPDLDGVYENLEYDPAVKALAHTVAVAHDEIFLDIDSRSLTSTHIVFRWNDGLARSEARVLAVIDKLALDETIV